MIKYILKYIVKIALVLLACFIIAICTIIFVGTRDHVKQANVIVILGTTVHSDGTPSHWLAARLNKGIELYHKGYAPFVIVSGGIGKEGYDEALAMKHYLIQHAIPNDAIITDNKGVNTRATAINTKEWMDKHHLNSAIVVSQYFHIPRIKLSFKDVGVQHIYYASPHYFTIRDVYSVPREVIAYPFYYFHLK